MRRRFLLLPAAAAAALFALAGSYPFPHTTYPTARGEGFIGSRRCGTCHGAEYAAWNRSGHARLVKAADGNTVLGDFTAGVVFAAGRERIVVAREEDAFVVEVTPASGAAERFTVLMTLGEVSFQGYLARDAEGTLRDLPVLWDVQRRRWIALPREPRTRRDWTERRYASECAHCHAVGVEIREASGEPIIPGDARILEFGVGCEACHGAGAAHADWRRVEAKGKTPKGVDPYLAIAAMSATARRDLCASCHAREAVVPPQWRPGSPLPAGAFGARPLPVPGSRAFPFWPDGGDEVPFASMGVPGLARSHHAAPERCGDCHDPHGSPHPFSLRADPDDPALCSGCHAGVASDPERHTGHPAASSGSRCVECHMPRTNTHYLAVTAAHDLRRHDLAGPDPGVSLRYGMPNACNLCHVDRSPEWARDAILARGIGSGGPGRSER